MSGPEFESFCSQAQVILAGPPLDPQFLISVWEGADKDLNRAINHLLGMDESQVVRVGGSEAGQAERKKHHKKHHKKDKKEKKEKKEASASADNFAADAFGMPAFPAADGPPAEQFDAGSWGMPQSAGAAGSGFNIAETAPPATQPAGGAEGFGGGAFAQMGSWGGASFGAPTAGDAAGAFGNAEPVDGGWAQPPPTEPEKFAEPTDYLGDGGDLAAEPESDSESDNDWWHRPHPGAVAAH